MLCATSASPPQINSSPDISFCARSGGRSDGNQDKTKERTMSNQTAFTIYLALIVGLFYGAAITFALMR